MDNITFGRYSPYSTFVHKVDARTKIFLLIAMMVMIFFKFTLWSTSIILSGVYFIFFILLMLISKVSLLDLFKSLASMWILLIFLVVIYIFIPNPNYSDRIAFYIGTYGVHWDAIYQSIYIFLRLLIILMMTMVLTSTTKPMDLTYGFEWYMTPLKVIRFPVHEIAMILSITLRFIPTLLEETKRIKKAQESRGADFDGWNIFKKIGQIVSLIIPLFVSAIDRSEELSNAMEVKGYDPKGKRTRYHILKFGIRDLISMFICLCIFGGVLTLFIFDKNGTTINILNTLFNIEAGF